MPIQIDESLEGAYRIEAIEDKLNNLYGFVFGCAIWGVWYCWHSTAQFLTIDVYTIDGVKLYSVVESNEWTTADEAKWGNGVRYTPTERAQKFIELIRGHLLSEN